MLNTIRGLTPKPHLPNKKMNINYNVQFSKSQPYESPLTATAVQFKIFSFDFHSCH